MPYSKTQFWSLILTFDDSAIMTLFCAIGSANSEFSADDLQESLCDVLGQLEPRYRVLALPPDFTRFKSMAGSLTSMAYQYYGDRLVDCMPALGTHHAMQSSQLNRMFPGLPHSLFRIHDWRNNVVTVGEVPASFVRDSTEKLYDKPWPVQMNRLVWEGGHDLILSIGQVVPHEVIGMANHNKNIFVGTGGDAGINESHYLSAVYGMERVMGRADTPLRRILNYAELQFCQQLPIVYVLTVVGTRLRQPIVRGLFIGDDQECFLRASELALEVNFTLLDREPEKVVVYLDPEEFHSTWLGNKAIYRTRMAIADKGELIVLAPGVKMFGEDGQIDRLIRKYGYRSGREIKSLVNSTDDLPENLSAAAHMIHGSSEGRFTVTYCPGHLSRAEIESVGYQFGELAAFSERYPHERLVEGWNEMSDGDEVYFVSDPGLGLWAYRERFGLSNNG